MSFANIFVGVPQSKYAASAVMFAIIAVSISILFGKDEMPLGQKIGAIILLILVSLPGVLYSLFQLTCLVSGAGVRNQRWWCSVYAWIISALLIVYSILLIAIAVLSVFTGSKVVKDISDYNVENFANSMAIAEKLATTAPSASYDESAKSNVRAVTSNTFSNGNETGYASSLIDASANNANPYATMQIPRGLSITPETFAGSIGVPNNRSVDIGGGGQDDPGEYPFNGIPGSHGWVPMSRGPA